MTYATRQNLADRYTESEVAQRESALPAGAVAQALSDADAEIDSYLAPRYAVPLSPVPAYVVRVACAIARYRLLGQAADDQARKDYEDARAWLRDVGAGRAQITGVAPVPSAAPAATVAVSSGREKVFRGGL